MATGHCMKCKEKRELVDPAIHQTAKGGFMAKGTCSQDGCGTTVCAMMSKDNAEKAIEEGATKEF